MTRVPGWRLFVSLATGHWSLATVFCLLLAVPLCAQTFPSPAYMHDMIYRPPAPSSVEGPQALKDYVVDGKLRLTLQDAVRLALLNNTDVRINQLQVEQSKFNLLGTYSPFDPALQSNYKSTRNTSPATNQLQGAPTVSSLFQQAQVNYTQMLETGTNATISFTGSKSNTNSSFYFINPYLSSSVNFQLTQPLLRNRGLFPNRAPIVIAQRSLNQSRQTFQAQVANSLQQVINQYWQVIGARESLKVARTSLDQAQASYQHDRRALELGALPPLDIYRSESQVAQRRVAAIQQEYALKQAEDQFRQLVGADLDPFIRALDVDLADNPEPAGELATLDAKTALEQALQHRPELEALRLQLSNDDTSLRLAHNSMLPDLELSALYASNGVGGNELVEGAAASVVIPGGFGDSLSQMAHFKYPTYGFTLSLNLPLRNHAAEAKLGQASVAKRNDLYQLRKAEQAVTLDVINSVHQLEQAKLSLEAAKISRDLAEKNLAAEQRKYELGSETIFFVLEAQTELAQAEVSLVQAEIGYQMAVTGVDRAMGTLLERRHVQISALEK